MLKGKDLANFVQKMNARIKAMKKSGNVNIGFLKSNLAKAGVEFTIFGGIKKKSLDEQGIRALEMQVPNSTGDRNYKAYGEEQAKKIEYAKKRQEELQRQIAEENRKSINKANLEEMLAMFYEGDDPKSRVYSSFMTSKKVYDQVAIENDMQEIGRRLRNGTFEPEEWDAYFTKWKAM